MQGLIDQGATHVRTSDLPELEGLMTEYARVQRTRARTRARTHAVSVLWRATAASPVPHRPGLSRSARLLAVGLS
jgi:hypothetical protein